MHNSEDSDQREESVGFPLRLALSCVMGGTFLYVLLWLKVPWAWTVLTAVAMVIGSGWFTARIVLGITRPTLLLVLIPTIGIGWLLFLCAILAVQGLI
jgi:hypothetical protein